MAIVFCQGRDDNIGAGQYWTYGTTTHISIFNIKFDRYVVKMSSQSTFRMCGGYKPTVSGLSLAPRSGVLDGHEARVWQVSSPHSTSVSSAYPGSPGNLTNQACGLARVGVCIYVGVCVASCLSDSEALFTVADHGDQREKQSFHSLLPGYQPDPSDTMAISNSPFVKYWHAIKASPPGIYNRRLFLAVFVYALAGSPRGMKDSYPTPLDDSQCFTK